MTQAALLALALVFPDGFPKGRTETMVLCRADSGWLKSEWRAHVSPPAVVEGLDGHRCHVLARPSGAPFYVASRDVVWRRDSAPVYLGSAWLRTISVATPAEEPIWIDGDDANAPLCHTNSTSVECLLLPWDAAGVIVARLGGRVHVALFDRGVTMESWRQGSGRLVRVHGPSAVPIEARALRLERSLRHGSGSLLEARAAPGVEIARVGARAFWISGGAADAFIEFRASEAAPLRLAVAALGDSAEAPLDVRLSIGESIDGDVRASNGVVEGATVVLSRVVDSGDARVKEEARPRERIAEATTDRSGRFTFTGLMREPHELLAIHPVHGRVRVVVTPPDYPRLLLKPRARIRGRVLRNGIPLQGAVVRMLPALDAVTGATNPLMLASVPVQTAGDGRFEIHAPDDGSIVLVIATADSARRIDLGEASSLGSILDLGDITLDEVPDVELMVDLPVGCTLQAAGPMGSAGLSIAAATRVAEARWRFRPPVPGRWLFAAVCGADELALDPPVIDTQTPRRGPVVLRVRR